MHPKATTLARTCLVCGASFLTTQRRIDTGHGIYCSRACYLSRSDATAEARFWAKVDKNGPIPPHRPELGPCWLWRGRTTNDGYGVFEPRPGRVVVAHRYGYALQVGPLADDLLACHHCDTPPCVRGTHLFSGTPADNSRDMVRKGRSATGDRAPLRLHPESVRRGSAHHQAKLNEDSVFAIRLALAAGSPYEPLAAKYSVSVSLIRAIDRNEIWKHVRLPLGS